MACAKLGCDNFGKPGLNIVGHGSFATKSGRRRRYRCKVCGQTLSTHTGTVYAGLRCSRREFDQVASLRVEGMSISATARVTGRSRNTIARWLAPPGETHAGRHILEDDRGGHREQDGPQKRHAIASAGAAGGDDGSGTDERRGDQQARSEAEPFHLGVLHAPRAPSLTPASPPAVGDAGCHTATHIYPVVIIETSPPLGELRR